MITNTKKQYKDKDGVCLSFGLCLNLSLYRSVIMSIICCVCLSSLSTHHNHHNHKHSTPPSNTQSSGECKAEVEQEQQMEISAAVDVKWCLGVSVMHFDCSYLCLSSTAADQCHCCYVCLFFVFVIVMLVMVERVRRDRGSR